MANTFDSTQELNGVWAALKQQIDTEHLRRINEMEKEGLFGKRKPWEHGLYPAEYAELAWRWGYYPYMYENHPNPAYNPLGILSLAWDIYREMSGSNGEFVIDGNLTSVEYPDRLRAVRVPTLIIAGEHDAVSLGMSKEMNANIAGSRLVLLPRSKHMTFVDQPDMFNRAVDSFIHAAETTSR